MVIINIDFKEGRANVKFASLQELLTALKLLKSASDGTRGMVDIAIKKPAPDVQFERGKIFVSRDCVARAKRAHFDVVHVLVIARQAIEDASNKTEAN